ncbi:MAG: bifunctional phosphoribosyl-AMP cyclohydrolase/phosphoribosyl-ATP diphosphatase HisIE [Bacteroidales bacterium]
MLLFDQFDKNKMVEGLIPAIIQDYATMQVSMLGYMNQEAFEKTVEERKVTFYSRTKRRLWTKGETSGNFLLVESIDIDCDNDALLIRVKPIGNTCHTGSKSCFNTRETEGFIGYLEALIRERYDKMPEGSYTTHLFKKGCNKIAQKVGEEAVETVIEAVAGNDDALIYEASDLIYHLIVLLVSKGYSLKEIEEELAKRHK